MSTTIQRSTSDDGKQIARVTSDGRAVIYASDDVLDVATLLRLHNAPRQPRTYTARVSIKTPLGFEFTAEFQSRP